MLISWKSDESMYVSTILFLAEHVYRPDMFLNTILAMYLSFSDVKQVRTLRITISIAGKSYVILPLYEGLIPARVFYCNILWTIYLKKNIEQSHDYLRILNS